MIVTAMLTVQTPREVLLAHAKMVIVGTENLVMVGTLFVFVNTIPYDDLNLTS